MTQNALISSEQAPILFTLCLRNLRANVAQSQIVILVEAAGE
jgi:hypothetical protein